MNRVVARLVSRPPVAGVGPQLLGWALALGWWLVLGLPLRRSLRSALGGAVGGASAGPPTKPRRPKGHPRRDYPRLSYPSAA